MQAALLGRDIAQRMIQLAHAPHGDGDELVVAVVGENHVPRQRQVRAVDLQQETGVCDGLKLRAHGFGERVEIRVIVGVKRVGLEQRDGAGRDRVHKRRAAVLRDRRAQVVEVALQRRIGFGLDFADALRARISRGAAALREFFQVVGEEF